MFIRTSNPSVGLHGNVGPDGTHCSTPRADDYPHTIYSNYMIPVRLPSRTVGHLKAVLSAMWWFMDTNVQYLLQDSPGYYGTRGWYNNHCRSCEINSTIYCVFLCPCSTGRRCHGAHTAYEKNNRYAARSPRWFGGTSPALLFRMCCVSTAYQWRMGDAHAAYEWRCHCVWCRAWELDHCVFTAQVAYAQRTSHERAAVNAILWRMAGVCIAHGLRTCRTYEYTS